MVAEVKERTALLTATEKSHAVAAEIASRPAGQIWIGRQKPNPTICVQEIAQLLGIDIPMIGLKKPANPDLDLWKDALQTLR